MNVQPSPTPDAEAEHRRARLAGLISIGTLAVLLIIVFTVPPLRGAFLAWFPAVIFPPFVEVVRLLAALGHLIGGLF